MILSTCELAPGEVEEWEVPVAYRNTSFETEVRVLLDSGDVREAVPADAEVHLTEGEGGVRVILGA